MKNPSEFTKPTIKIILFLLLMGQFLQLSGKALQISGPREIIGASDDDASVAIGVALKSKWWNDNTFRAYGNFYYRIAHSLYWLNPTEQANNSFSKRQLKEKSLHFYLILINIIALFLSLFLISKFISQNSLVRQTFIVVMIPALISNTTWSTFLLRPHPEIFFSFLTIFSIFLMIKLLTFPKNKSYFFWSAFSWGICTGTKMTSLLFAPAILLIILENFNKKQFLKALKYFGYVCLGYFSVGFPQNFIIHKTIRMLLAIGKYSQPMTLESIQYWLELFSIQLIIPFLITLTFILLFKEKNKNKINYKIFLIFLIPFFLLITKNTVLPHDHYPFAFVLTFLIIFSYSFKGFSLSEYFKKYQLLFLFFALFLTRFSLGFVPKSIDVTYSKLTPCRNEYTGASKIINKIISSGAIVLADPYTPVDDFNRQSQVKKSWRHNLDDINDSIGIIALNSSYYGRYTGKDGPSNYVKTDISDWPKVRKYYQLFDKKNEVIFQNKKWVKIFDKCNLQLWKPRFN